MLVDVDVSVCVEVLVDLLVLSDDVEVFVFSLVVVCVGSGVDVIVFSAVGV